MDSFDREQYLQQLREYYSGDRDRIDQFLEDMSDSLDCYLKELLSERTPGCGCVRDLCTFRRSRGT